MPLFAVIMLDCLRKYWSLEFWGLSCLCQPKNEGNPI